MVIRIQKMKPKSGKILEAQKFVMDYNELVKKKYPQMASEVYSESFGDVGAIHFYSQYKDLADLEKTIAAAIADQELMAFYAKGLDLFIEGSEKVTILRTL